MREREARQLARKYGIEQITDCYKTRKGFVYTGLIGDKKVTYQVRFDGEVAEKQGRKFTIL